MSGEGQTHHTRGSDLVGHTFFWGVSAACRRVPHMKFRREKVAIEAHWEEEPDNPGDDPTVHRMLHGHLHKMPTVENPKEDGSFDLFWPN